MAIEFRTDDPFPLVTSPYQDQKNHAAEVDEWLGFRTGVVEGALKSRLKSCSEDSAADREFWTDKSVQTFSTPYTELRALLEDLKLPPNGSCTIFDLGCGYGRMAHVLGRHYPRVKFVGFELAWERQIEAQRVIDAQGLRNARVFCEDAANIDFSKNFFNDGPADFYFMYDFGSRADVEKCVENLKTAARSKAISVIARGGRSRDIIEKLHPWLSQVVNPLHRDHYSIYGSGESTGGCA